MSDPAKVEYVEAPGGPFKVGEYRGDPIMCFGAYRVTLGDFRALIPHSGFLGTVSECPVDLDVNPEFRDHLVERAARLRQAGDGRQATKEGSK